MNEVHSGILVQIVLYRYEYWIALHGENVISRMSYDSLLGTRDTVYGPVSVDYYSTTATTVESFGREFIQSAKKKKLQEHA